jgi:hypothetical protein
MGQHSPWILGELGKDAVFFGSKVYVRTVPPNAAGKQVDLQVIYVHNPGSIGADPLAKRSSKARKNLVGVERLGHIVVCAEVKRGDLLLRCFAR